MPKQFPLEWPAGWNRENGREVSAFKNPITKAHAELLAEIRRMNGSDVVVSTNVPLRVDGTMRMDRDPVDPGVAVYFKRNGKQMVFACDRYDVVRDNIISIAKTMEAMRGIERWGAASMMERAFAGFSLAVMPTTETKGEAAPWWEVLSVSRDADKDVINAAFRAKAKMAHPDRNGGSYQKMQLLNEARDRALKERGA